jgi:hypothetical protein
MKKNRKKEWCDMHPKDLFRLFTCSYIPFLRNIPLPSIVRNLEKEAVFIEFRVLCHLEFILRNTILKLGKEWSHTVVCGTSNESFFRKVISKLNHNNIVNNVNNINIRIIVLPYDNICTSTYSKILSEESFWEQFQGNKLLIYQEDSCIFKYRNINDYLEWDYIGAPWYKHPLDKHYVSVGNGGFSLRTKQCMIDVIRTCPIMKTTFSDFKWKCIKDANFSTPPEDIYFTFNMDRHKIGKIADWYTASTFSSESFDHKTSLGCHNFWLYVDKKNKWYDGLRHRLFPFLLISLPFLPDKDSIEEKNLMQLCTHFITQQFCFVYICCPSANMKSIKEMVMSWSEQTSQHLQHAFAFYDDHLVSLLHHEADFHIYILQKNDNNDKNDNNKLNILNIYNIYNRIIEEDKLFYILFPFRIQYETLYNECEEKVKEKFNFHTDLGHYIYFNPPLINKEKLCIRYMLNETL